MSSDIILNLSTPSLDLFFFFFFFAQTNKILQTCTFPYIPQFLLAVRFGTSEERKAIHLKTEKQMFSKQMFAGLRRDNGTHGGLWFLGPA